jgi:hypothetical protein
MTLTQARNRGRGVLAQGIDRPHLMSINSDRIRQHSKPEMTTMSRCNLFQRRKVLLLQNINTGRNLSDSGCGTQQQEKQADPLITSLREREKTKDLSLRRSNARPLAQKVGDSASDKIVEG